MYRVLCLIENRIREEHLDENDISKCSYPLMMMEDVFVNMTQDISLYTVCNVIIDKRLVCCPYAKSELKRSIKERDLQLFKDIIKEYNIDYKPASDICSRICICSNMLGDIQNVLESKEEGAVNSLSDKESEENLNIEVRALYEDVLMIIRKKMEEDYCSDEEITGLQDFGDWLRNNTFDFSSPENCIQSFGLHWCVCFEILVNTLNEYAREQKLTFFDNRIITQFIEKKKAEMPIVQGFFTLFTKGDVLGDDFVFTEPKDVEFLEMIEQGVSGETNEQQVLPDDENTGISNFKIVANPTLAELPLPHVLAWDENEARKIIMRAIEQGYMDLKKKGKQYIYNWLNSGVALVYFCGRLCCGDYTKPDSEKQYNEWKQGDGKKIPKKELFKQFLLNGKNLKDGIFQSRRKAKSKSVKSGPRPSPSNHKDIDELFENQQL